MNFLLGFLLSLAPAGQEVADTVFVDGTVLTLDPRSSVAEAVALRGEKILAVGTNEEIRKRAGPATTVRSIRGRTLVPGFVAAHDHFPGAGETALYLADLNSPPIGRIRNLKDLIEALREKARATPAGGWVVGRGYDDTLLEEKRHPTRHDLDPVSADHPIWIVHTSGHLGVANSKALALAKITRETPQPSGGVIRIDPRTGEPDGVIEESVGLVSRLIPRPTRAQSLAAIEWSSKEYTRRGVTTTVIAGGNVGLAANLKAALEKGDLLPRVVLMSFPGSQESIRKELEGVDRNRLRSGAVKVVQDGSIQGLTGYLSQPYAKPPPSDPAHRGYPRRPRKELANLVLELHREGHQVAIHGNGDAAIDDILFAFEAAQKAFPRPDARHRIEHAQMAREDQLDAMKRLGVTPSFFAGHVYYWGERHRDLFLGTDRAARISPLRSSLDRGVRFTLHDDTPVTPVHPLQLVWVAAVRKTRDGRILGGEQRISAEQALRAVTSEAAWQNFEEELKGSIVPGKLADFVILDANPLQGDREGIRDVKVLETVVGGRTVYAQQ